MSWYQSTLFSYQGAVFDTKKCLDSQKAKKRKKIADIQVSAISQLRGGGTRTRTLIDGFGDRCTTFVRYPQYVRSYKDLAICDTFDISTLPAKFVLKCFMIFGRDLSSSLVISALISSSLSCCGKYFLITFS